MAVQVEGETVFRIFALVDSGTALILVYYQHKATGDVILAARGAPMYCLLCESFIGGTKPHTRREYATNALIAHLKQHGKRTRKRNPAALALEA